MRFVQFSTTDGPGGAGTAAYRLHAALQDAGHTSELLVRSQSRGDRTAQQVGVRTVPVNKLVTQFRRLQKHLPLVRPPRARFTFNHDCAPRVAWRRVLETVERPLDAICLHWVADFLTTKSIRAIYQQLDVPLLWTMMDQEPVTGGCHYSFGCDGYRRGCGNCPLLERPSAVDRSRQVYQRKQGLLSDLPITFVAPTSWVEKHIRASGLFGGHRVERIGLPIDTGLYRRQNRQIARENLRLPRDKQIIFFGSSFLNEPRKGGDYLIEGIRRLYAEVRSTDDVLLLMAGHNGEILKRQLPFPVSDLGYLRDERQLASAYQAADVFVCPSIEDAGPMMIPEAMLCGTPVVAFAAGGAPDLVTSGESGYLARLGDAGELAHGIQQVLCSSNRVRMSETAAKRARELHEPHIVAGKYVALVDEVNRQRCGPANALRGAAA